MLLIIFLTHLNFLFNSKPMIIHIIKEPMYVLSLSMRKHTTQNVIVFHLKNLIHEKMMIANSSGLAIIIF